MAGVRCEGRVVGGLAEQVHDGADGVVAATIDVGGAVMSSPEKTTRPSQVSRQVIASLLSAVPGSVDGVAAMMSTRAAPASHERSGAGVRSACA